MANQLKINLKLDIAPFSKGLVSALKMGKNFGQQFQKLAAGMKVDVDESAFKKEIKNLEKIYSDFDKKIEGDSTKLTVNGKQAKSEADKVKKATDKIPKKKHTLFSSNAKSFATNIATVGVAFTAVFMAISKVKNKLGELVNLSNLQAKAEAKVAQALKSTGGTAGYTAEELAKVATELQNITNFGDEVILNQVTAQLLTFTNITNDQFLRTQKVVLDLATVLDGDLKSASLQLGKALNDPIANLSALTRSGIQFSTEQKEVIKTLANTNRLAEAQDVILKELERQYGGQAEAARIADEGIAGFGNRVGDLKESLGSLIKKGLVPTINVMGRMVDGAIDFLDPGTNLADNLENQTKKAANLTAKFYDLTSTLLILSEKEKLSNEEMKIKKDTIAELQSTFPNYFSNLETQSENYATLKIAISNANTELKNYTNYFSNLETSATNYDDLQTAIGKARQQLEDYTNQMIQNAVIQKYSDEIADLSVKMIENNTTIAQAELANEKLRQTFTSNITDLAINNNAIEHNNLLINICTTENTRLEEKLNDVKDVYKIAKQAADDFTKAIVPPKNTVTEISKVTESLKTVGGEITNTTELSENMGINFKKSADKMEVATVSVNQKIKESFQATGAEITIHLANMAGQWVENHQGL